MLDWPANTGSPDTAQHRRLLLVETDIVIAMDIADLVGTLGYAVVGPAPSCAEAQSLLETSLPDGVLPDCALLDPKAADGAAHDLARALRLAGVPFAWVSTASYKRPDGPEPVLVMPWHPQTLRRVVESLTTAAGP